MTVQHFNYELIGPNGSPIKCFEGVSSGPACLMELHVIRSVLDAHRGRVLSITAIVDIMNLIGMCGGCCLLTQHR